MKKSILLIALLLLSLSSAIAKEAKPKEIQQNDKVRVYEITYAPGDTSPVVKRPMRVIYAIHGGTFERTYDDGSKERAEWKTGETRIISEERAYGLKNVGKSTIHLYIVAMK